MVNFHKRTRVSLKEKAVTLCTNVILTSLNPLKSSYCIMKIFLPAGWFFYLFKKVFPFENLSQVEMRKKMLYTAVKEVVDEKSSGKKGNNLKRREHADC